MERYQMTSLRAFKVSGSITAILRLLSRQNIDKGPSWHLGACAVGPAQNDVGP